MSIADTTGSETEKEGRSAAVIVYAFPTFILLGSIIAFLFPAPFVPLTEYLNLFLTIIMFTMGLTLTVPISRWCSNDCCRCSSG